MSVNAVQEIIDHAKRISDRQERVYPGMPARFTEAATVNDRIWQGDLALTIIAAVPKDYVVANDFKGQLVPGQNQGARHCLDNVNSTEVYLPPVWNEESLDGPVFVTLQESTVVHPVHGDVTIPAGFVVNCTYQREWDKEQARERRAID